MSETSVTAASAVSGEPGGAAQQDGRLTRAARTRAAVVDALLTLNEQGNVRPTARDIANQAGVSLRSLYVHFDDLEALFIAASQRQGERLAQVVTPLVVEGSLAERLDAFVARRQRIHEFGAGVHRAALLQEPFSPALKQALSLGRHLLYAEVRRCFAPEIDAAGPGAGTRLARALDIVTGSGTWGSLRTHQGLSVDETAAQVRDMALALISSWVPADDADTPCTRSTSYAAETPGTPAATSQASATTQPPAVGPQG